jgi:transcriptional regulator with XRE-family HTH domain
MDIFKERLAQVMQEKGIKAATLARETGVSKTTISKYLSEDDRKHAFDIVLKIARVLDISPEWLGGMTDERKPFYEPSISEIYQQLSPDGQKQLLDYASYLLEKEKMEK